MASLCCYLELAFLRLCDHIISEFWNFVKHFLKLFWTFFRCPWFSFTDSDAQFCFQLVFVSFLLFGGDRHIIHMFSPNVKHFLKNLWKKFQENSYSLIWKEKEQRSFLCLQKKSRTFFSSALPFYGDYMKLIDVKGRVHTIYHRACKMVWVKCACLC